MIKSYKYSVDPNVAKLYTIEQIIYPEWKRIATILMKRHVNYLYKTSNVCLTNELYKDISTTLSERYKDCINRQIVGMLKGKLKNFKRRYNKIVNSYGFATDMQIKLNFMYKANLIFYRSGYESKNIVIDYETIKLGRWIFKNFIGRYPSTKNINMVLQDKVAMLESIDNINTDRYSFVLRLSTNIKGKLIDLPILRNKYADKFDGNVNSSTEMCFNNGKLSYLKISKDIEPSKDVLSDSVISFDIGLTTLIATSDGKLYGMRYLRDLRRFDKNLITLTNKLKEKYGKHAKLTTIDEYNRLVSRIKAYSKNEINRILNVIHNKHKPKQINVENLDFSKSNIGKELNRLLNRFGLGYITSKLESFKEYGVKIKYVDPAYSSQMCSNCDYVDKANRVEQSKFMCKCCGLKIHADVNGSRVVSKFAERFGETVFYGNKGRSAKLNILVNDFISKNIWMNTESGVQIRRKNKYFQGIPG